jgi:hypothetical protein
MVIPTPAPTGIAVYRTNDSLATTMDVNMLDRYSLLALTTATSQIKMPM